MNQFFTSLKDTIRKTKYLFFLMLASVTLQAQTKWYVNDNSTSGDIYTTAIGNNANAGTSASAPKLTLGAAYTAAASGDIIYVDKGTFTGTGNKSLTLNKAITIIGAGTGNTIFTSHTDDRFATIAANNVSIQNLQLYDFFLATGNGQALLVNANVTGFKLTNVVMKKNYGSSGTGESIYLSSGSSSTFDGLFFSCSGFNGASGGAIKVNSCTLEVKNSAFSQSRDADGKGGAIEISGTTSVVTVDNTSFDGNSARAGGAIAQNQGKLYVTNSCFNRNYIQGDSSSSTNGGGHYYAVSTDTNLIASFTNCKFQGAFFCATTNPTGYLCESSTNTSNDGAAFSLRGTSGTFTFDTCLFDNSNMPALNFDNGLDFYVQPSGAMLLTINNCKFANDLTNLSASKARNIFISGTLNNTTQKVIVTNSGASATANRDGVTGNNFSLSGTLTTGSNSAVATSDATASCGTTIAGCTIAVNCATEANAPVITACAPNQTLSSCSGTLPDYRPLIAAFDDCDFTITQSPAPGTSLSTLGNGNHTITFTVSDQSPNSPNTTCTMVLTLSGCYTCNPSLSYPNTEVCSASAAVTPTFSPAGGTFTSASGLTIDATTGEIDPSTSTAGTYTITYTPNTSYPTCTTTSTIKITAAPAQPTIACYQTATLNAATCTWEVTGTQPAQPTLACYQTATFNTATCAWDVTGTQPAQPTLACYETATFNTSTCAWDVTGTQPAQPTLACYETATFNTSTCAWDVTGTQPAQPTLACYETATFNTSTCAWDVTGTQPEQPTLACYETATFNTSTCAWDVTGTQPAQPTLACYQTATFNTSTCAWDVTGTQPAQPTLACYETATFNTTTCAWDVTGTQPAQPTLACYETATFNTSTCAWDVTGTQPAQPTLACYETATFNTSTCAWDVTGTQPAQPTLACYETATFNTSTCAWDVTGTQPAQPTLACYETATFNTTTCGWDVTGTQPEQPTLACYETATFNTTTCAWDVTGTALTASATAGTITCNGGTTDVTVSATGGTAPYTVSPAQTGLAAGAHEFTIVDANGCTTTVSVTITEPDTLTASATAGTITCNGGTTDVTVSANGGTAPYTIFPAQTGLAAGTHSFTVTDANGCTATVSVTITEPAVLSLTTTTGTIACNGGVTDVVVTPVGGTAPYTISPEQAGLSAGLHDFTVTDANGCTATATIDIPQPKSLFVTVNAGTILCNGGTTSVEIDVVGGTAPYTITPAQTGLTAGTHEFTIVDAHGCTTSTTVTLTEPAAFTASITSSKGNSFCFGETTTLSASNGASYLWNTGATTATISVAVSGTYSVTVTNSNGCQATASLAINANNCTPACPSTNNLLQNGSFENPSKYGYYGFEQMPYWTNAADGNKVEIMGANLYCVGCWTAPSDGIQFIELNANNRGNIHQDVAVLPNKSLDLSFMHRARESAVGVEKLRVTLSDPTDNSNVYTFDVTAVYGVWKKVTGSYVTGPNQTSVRVRLQTIASMFPGSGNYLDNVILNYKDCGPNRVAITGSNYICTSAASSTLSVTNTLNAVSYLWSTGATTPTITVSQAGSYYVKVTFANGTSSISDPFVVADFLTSATINGTTAFCSGTSSVLTATGGTSYLWNTGATTASITVTNSGTYSVTISNPNGCSVVKQIIVNTSACTPGYCPSSNNLLTNGSFENPAITTSWNTVSVPNWTNLVDGNKIEVHKNVLNIPIPNGSQYIELNGSTYGKIYQDVTVLTNKTLQLSFMFRGRTTSTESIKVTLYDPITNTNIYSFNSTATYNVWKKITANYTSAVNQTKVRVKIEGLTGNSPGAGNLIDDINLNYYDCANSSAVIVGNHEICNGSSTTLSLLNNNNVVSYLWSNGSTNPIISVNQPGNYSVTVTLNNGTTLTSSTFVVNECNYVINRQNDENKGKETVINYNVILYPNPTVDAFSVNIVSDSGNAIEISIYDIQGRTIETKIVKKEDLNSINIGSNLPSGIYNVVVKQGENSKSQRLIKN